MMLLGIEVAKSVEDFLIYVDRRWPVQSLTYAIM